MVRFVASEGRIIVQSILVTGNNIISLIFKLMTVLIRLAVLEHFEVLDADNKRRVGEIKK